MISGFQKAYLSAFLLIAVLTAQSCKTPAKYLVNNWQVQKFQPGEDFSASPEHMKIFHEFEKYARFEFKSDGSYFFDLVGSRQQGTWKFDKKSMTLTTTDENQQVTVSKVKELTPEKLVLEQQSDGYNNTIILVPKQPE